MTTTYQQSAQILLNNRQAGLTKQRLVSDSRPQSSEQALLIQAEMMALCEHNVAAWKCLLPLNDDQLVVAPIFANTIQSGDQCALVSDNGKVRIEPEIAFILDYDLPARAEHYSELEIDNALRSCHMALELIEDRFLPETDISFYEKLADCLSNQGVFIGPEIDKAQAALAGEFMINIEQAENKQCFNGQHPNALPKAPIYWLINAMRQRGINFKAGQAIITGSYAGVVEVDFNHSTRVEYVGLGDYQVTFKQI